MILIHTELKGSEFVISTIIENTPSLHLNRKKFSKKTEGFDSIGEINVAQSMVKDILVEHDYYVKDVFHNSNTQYIKDVIGYIAGFIARQLETVISCQVCLKQLTCKSTLSSLQKEKCRGRLKSASLDVIQICETAERQFRSTNILRKKNVLHYLMVMTLRNIHPSILSENSEHMFEQGFLEDHRTQVIKLIILKYLTLRLRHSTTGKNDVEIRIRHQLTKTILFKNQ